MKEQMKPLHFTKSFPAMNKKSVPFLTERF
jgi:hypothetical protein